MNCTMIHGFANVKFISTVNCPTLRLANSSSHHTSRRQLHAFSPHSGFKWLLCESDMQMRNFYLLTCICLTAGVNLLTPSIVRFVTSSQPGLTCVGAECGKEGGGGMNQTSVAPLTNQLCSDRGVVRVFEYSINVLYYKYGRNQS